MFDILSFLDFEKYLNAVASWGLGIVLAIILILMFRRFISRVFDQFSVERKMYKDIIDRQNTVLNNHMTDLTKAVRGNLQATDNLSNKIELVFNKLVNEIKIQTHVLKDNKKTKKRKSLKKTITKAKAKKKKKT